MKLFNTKNPAIDAKLVKAQFTFNDAIGRKLLSAEICSSYFLAMIDSSMLSIEMLEDALAVTRASGYYSPEIYTPVLKALLKLTPDNRDDSNALARVAIAIRADIEQYGLKDLIEKDLILKDISDVITKKCKDKSRLTSSRMGDENPASDEHVAYGKSSGDDESDDYSVGLDWF